jgi:hypothetical protein
MTIAVMDQRSVAGFGPWTVKAGIPHVEAPATLLDRMVAVRIHLDDCGAETGALLFIPGSHKMGKLAAADRKSITASTKSMTCTAKAGNVLLMRPLLLHRSSPARRPVHRRVVHIEYAVGELPGGLRWHVSRRSRSGGCQHRKSRGDSLDV